MLFQLTARKNVFKPSPNTQLFLPSLSRLFIDPFLSTALVVEQFIRFKPELDFSLSCGYTVATMADVSEMEQDIK